MAETYKSTSSLNALASALQQVIPEWMSEGLCGQADPELFYPEKGGSNRDARRMCTTCPVRRECLAYALEHDEHFGIWGGLSERERRKLKHPERYPDGKAVVCAYTGCGLLFVPRATTQKYCGRICSAKAQHAAALARQAAVEQPGSGAAA